MALADRGQILFADDSDAVREVYTKILNQYLPGFDVDPFSSGQELEARLERGTGEASLVILDYIMPPGRTGIDIIRRYAGREFCEVPFILFSSKIEELAGMRVPGRVSYISNPAGVKEFVDKVNSALDRSSW